MNKLCSTLNSVMGYCLADLAMGFIKFLFVSSENDGLLDYFLILAKKFFQPLDKYRRSLLSN